MHRRVSISVARNQAPKMPGDVNNFYPAKCGVASNRRGYRSRQDISSFGKVCRDSSAFHGPYYLPTKPLPKPPYFPSRNDVHVSLGYGP